MQKKTHFIRKAKTQLKSSSPFHCFDNQTQLFTVFILTVILLTNTILSIFIFIEVGSFHTLQSALYSVIYYQNKNR